VGKRKSNPGRLEGEVSFGQPVRPTFWQAYWKLSAGVAKALLFCVGMAAYGYLAGSFMAT
jgi:hypothetical protein